MGKDLGQLEVQPLLHVERSQLRWVGHLIRMYPRHPPLEVSFELSTRRRTLNQPRTHWRDYISYLAWESLGIPQAEPEDVAGEEDLPHLLPPLIRMDGRIKPHTLFELSVSLNFVQEGVWDLMVSCKIKQDFFFFIWHFQSISLTINCFCAATAGQYMVPWYCI